MNALTHEFPIVSRSSAVGPELQTNGTHFRVWAPKRRSVDLVLFDVSAQPGDVLPLEAEGNGYFSGLLPDLTAGARYKFRLDEGDSFPDPASHSQPDGPHGASEVVDHRNFPWTDAKWKGVHIRGQVLYEMHIGTFTPQGTYAAAREKLPLLKDVGITVLELMPVASFPGKFGWGYDGVSLFAPYPPYGNPDELRAFVDDAHALGLGVILDVVYNHLGPDGNYLTQFSDDYFHTSKTTEWGDAINFDGENNEQVREFFLANAEFWIREYHFDGLRLDATQSIYDNSREHVLCALSTRARAAAGNREIILVAENEAQESRLARPQERSGYGIDALWNDDFHHTAVVALTGNRAAYYTDYCGSPQEFISAVKYGYLYQGQRYSWQKHRRGQPTLGMEPTSFVTFIENHDQVANSAYGRRLHQLTSPPRFRAMTAFMLLAPGTPMLFQGQEFGSTRPFTYFADHNPDLSKLVYAGRTEFLTQFPTLETPEMRTKVLDPAAKATLEGCILDWNEREQNTQMVDLHRDLLRLRRTDAAFRMQSYGKVDGAVLGPSAFVLRFFVEAGLDRLVIVNFGADLHLTQAPEPLLAPPDGKFWGVMWSSEDQKYGGSGYVNPDTDDNWRVPAESTMVLGPMKARESGSPSKNSGANSRPN
jgi:maltooligosyltrehalose trehalohydrolase